MINIALFIAGVVAILIATKIYSGIEYDTSIKNITIIRKIAKVSVSTIITIISIGFCIYKNILFTYWGFIPLGLLICTIGDYVLMISVIAGASVFAAGYLTFPLGLFFQSGLVYNLDQPTIIFSLMFIITFIYIIPSIEKEAVEPIILYGFVQYIFMCEAGYNAIYYNNLFIIASSFLLFFSDLVIAINQYKFKVKYRTYIVMSTYWIGLYTIMCYLITMNV